MIDPINFIIGAIWGSATLVSWTVALLLKWQEWRQRRDGRSRRELVQLVPLWAVASLFAVVLLLYVVRDATTQDPALRGVLFGMLFASFTGAGVLRASDAWRHRHDIH